MTIIQQHRGDAEGQELYKSQNDPGVYKQVEKTEENLEEERYLHGINFKCCCSSEAKEEHNFFVVKPGFSKSLG